MTIRSFLHRAAIALVSATLSFTSSAAEAKAAVKNLKVEAAAKLLAEKKEVVILDVRTPEEFKEGHLKGAVNIDIRGKNFQEQVAKLDKSKTYLVNCAAGGRSATACTSMGGMGFTNAFNLEGGFRAWSAAGQPVVKP